MFFTIKLHLHLNCVLMLNWVQDKAWQGGNGDALGIVQEIMWRQRWNGELHNKWMQLTGTKGVQDMAWLGGKGASQGIVQKIKIWLYY